MRREGASKEKNNKLLAVVTLLAIAIISFGSIAPVAHAAEVDAAVIQKRVLYISSYSFSWGTVPLQMEGLSEGLGNEYVVDYEFMDTKNTVYSDNYQEFYELLKYKLSTRKPYDAVVVCDDAALNFIQIYKEELFPDKPIVFSGIDNVENGVAAANDSNMTGIVEIVDYKKNMELAHRLMPEAKKLVLILDNMENGVGIAEQLKNSSKAFADYDVEFLNSSDYTRVQWKNKLGELNDSEIVFCISMGQCADGSVYSEEERYALVRDFVKVPMFRFTQSGVGEGLLGGYIVNHKESCKKAARMLRNMIEKNQEDDICMETPSEYYFDYTVMDQYGITEKDLPSNIRGNSTIINKPDSFFVTYAYQLVIGLLVVLIIVLAISYMRIHTNKVLAEERAAEVEEKNVELQKASRAKTDFLSRMSHDIRTPLNAIIGFSGLAEQEPELSDEVNDYLGKINNSGKYLLGLINDVLDMSKIESDKYELHEEVVDGPKFLNSIADTFRAQVEEKGIHFETNFTESQTPWVIMDELRSRQVYTNLLNNALKFSPEGSTIRWSIIDKLLDDNIMEMVCTISDEGCGMSEDFQKRIFTPFEQEQNIYSDHVEGTGLGLSIVKSLVDLMGGEISVESELNKGSTFTITMKRRLSQGRKIQTNRQQSADVISILRGKKILLCEDHPLNTEIAVKLLERENMMVTTAINGKIGFDLLVDSAPNTFDAVIMDIRMPVMDGIEATKAIRGEQRADLQRIPIIAMSANAFAEDVQNCLDAGMNAHLAKPINPDELYQMLAEQIQNKNN